MTDPTRSQHIFIIILIYVFTNNLSLFVFVSSTPVFNQGDEGKSWYIILKGSVNVVIYGKGVVCTLHEGDDFGKLALVNDAPRAASIVLREDNCHFLRVDKEDFNRILRVSRFW